MISEAAIEIPFCSSCFLTLERPLSEVCDFLWVDVIPPCDFSIGPDVEVKVLAGLFFTSVEAKVVLLLISLGLVLFGLTSILLPKSPGLDLGTYIWAVFLLFLRQSNPHLAYPKYSLLTRISSLGVPICWSLLFAWISSLLFHSLWMGSTMQ